MQKGQTPVLILVGILVIIAVTGGAYYIGKTQAPKSQPQNSVITSQTPQPATSAQPTQTSDETANWKTYKFTDKNGFGYQIKIPPEWTNLPWGGGHTNPNPQELAQIFSGKNCGIGKEDSIRVLHFMSNNPQLAINNSINSLKKDGFTSSKIVIGDGKNVEKLTGNIAGYIDLYVYIVTSKGYYDIHSRVYCSENLEQYFDQILSTFKFQ